MIFFIGGSNYLHYKMKKEYLTYTLINNEIQILNDIYSLCSGLVLANPTKENVDSCNFVYKKIEYKIEEVKKKSPHIYFYTKYISD